MTHARCLAAGVLLVLATSAWADDEAGSITVKLVAETTEVYPMEPVSVVRTVQNTGKETVKYFPVHEQLWSVEYKGPDGEKSEQPRGPWTRFDDVLIDHVVHIGPGAVLRQGCPLRHTLEHVSGQPGTYRVRAVVWSSGKAVLGGLRLRWLRATEDKPQPAIVSNRGDEQEELRDASGKGSNGAAPEPPIQEVDCWKGKAVSNEIEIRLKPLESEDDRKAQAILLGSRTPETFSWTGVDSARLRQVLKEYPGSVYAKYCAYSLAERRRRMHSQIITIQAAALYEKVIQGYPPFQLTDDAKFYVAKHCLVREPEKARPLLEEILKSHPDSSGAIAAEEVLAKLPAAPAPGTTGAAGPPVP